MSTLRFTVAFLGILSFASSDVLAQLVGASVSPTRFNCAAAGDPTCAGGQVLGDPATPVAFTVASASGIDYAQPVPTVCC